MHGPGLCHSRQGKRIAGCNLKARAMGCEPTQFALVKLESFLSYHLAVVRGWWSASNVSQQLSLSSFSQQPSSAIILLWSGVGGQLAAFLSSFSQQLFSGVGGWWSASSFSQQLFSASGFSAAFSQQLFSAAILSYHLTVVRGWWSAGNVSQQPSSAIILLWSGVGGQLAAFLS